ncbi:hypothetical protein HanPI659440_Chr12g0448141 [Helianthus annuus]|nr:hypothetical protein HanPI659440_Chr12g0448141 [Helianthus annuus]
MSQQPLDEGYSTFGSRARASAHLRLGPPKQHWRESDNLRGLDIHSLLGALPNDDNNDRTDLDDSTYYAESHSVFSRLDDRDAYIPTQPRTNYDRAGKHDYKSVYRPKSTAGNSKFIKEIALAPLMQSKLPPSVGKYNGLSNPDDHIGVFTNAGLVGGWMQPLWCNLFSQTLTGKLRAWCDSLPMGSLVSYEDLQEKFLVHFSQQRRHVHDTIGRNEYLAQDQRRLGRLHHQIQ